MNSRFVDFLRICILIGFLVGVSCASRKGLESIKNPLKVVDPNALLVVYDVIKEDGWECFGAVQINQDGQYLWRMRDYDPLKPITEYRGQLPAELQLSIEKFAKADVIHREARTATYYNFVDSTLYNSKEIEALEQFLRDAHLRTPPAP